MRPHSCPIRSKPLLAVSALAVALFSAPARAQGAATSEAASAEGNLDPAARFAQAVKLFKASKLAEALPIFEQLFTDTGSPNAALYVGHCLSGLERNAEAYDAYSRAVRAAAQDPKYAQAREAAQAQLSALGVRVAKLVLSLDETPEGVRVSVDEKPVELAALGSPIALEPGVHAVVVEAEGREPSKREVLIEAGETKTVTLSLDKKPSEEKALAAPAPAAPRAQDLRPQLRLAGYVAGGVGTLGFLTLTLAGLEAKSTNASLARECSRGCSDREHLDAIDHGKTMQTLANVGLVVGAVGVAASGTLLFLGFSGGAESGPSASLSPFGAELGYRGRF
jgi:hypothetical protein